MAHGAARRSVDVARGAQIGLRQNFTYLENLHWMVLGDVNAPHKLPPHVPGPDAMAQGSPFCFVNGISACRQGHLAGCGHPTTGSQTTFIET